MNILLPKDLPEIQDFKQMLEDMVPETAKIRLDHKWNELPYSFVFRKENSLAVIEDFIIMKYPIDILYDIVTSNEKRKDLYDKLRRLKKLKPNYQYTMVIEGLDSFIKSKSKQINQQLSKGSSNMPAGIVDSFVGRERFEEFLIPFQLDLQITIRFMNSREEIAKYISKLHESISLLPLAKENLFENICVDAIRSKHKNPQQIWIHQLFQINGISISLANIIVSKYPSISSLYQHFLQFPENSELRMYALADIQVELSNGKYRSLGKSLSKKIHDIYFSTDPNKIIN